MNYVEKIAKLNPCNAGREFLVKYDNEQDAWNNCNEPAYKLWYIGRTSGEVGSPERKKLVKTLFDIANLCRPCEDKQLESLRQEGIKVGYDYCEDKATLSERKVARNKLWHAYADTAADAVYAAVYAVYAAYAAVYAAYADAYYVPTTYAAACAEKAGVIIEQQLEIINQHYPIPPEF